MSSSLRKMVKKQQPTGGANASHGPVIDIRNDKQFRDLVLEAEVPVLVDFWAPWCQPCKLQGPAFTAAARELDGAVRFAKVNTEASPGLARTYGISSIPSLLAFSRGEVIDARVGLSPQSAVVTLAKRTLDRHQGIGVVGKLKRLFGGAPTEAPTAPSNPPGDAT